MKSRASAKVDRPRRERMMKLHKDPSNVKMPHERESIQRQIAATDQQIDALVNELYGLTEEEVRIGEGVT